MGTREGAVLAVVLLVVPAAGQTQEEEKPAKDTSVSPAALVAAGVAAALALGSRGGGGGDGGGGGSGGGGTGTAPRSLSYTSPADFRTSEYGAQQGLGMVHADSLYYNGHYRWYTGAVANPAAGTGVGVKIAVGDTGINAREASSGSTIAIDTAASYDYVADRAGSGRDDYGHGTHVAGIIAAPKNGTGMHGLAYNAKLVNFKLGGSTITATDAERGDMLARAAAAGAMVINNSWATHVPVTARSAEELQSAMPQFIARSRSYVGAGGVVVFAAGNDDGGEPSLESGLPHRVGALQRGWLAVVAVDGSGRLAGYSNRCGVAAAWCLAAPGGSASAGIYSMQSDGGYETRHGTSMAAPHAAAAIGALKSMFPNLSWQQLRDRLLTTANRDGAYADRAAYGQGLMDLDAASSPVGGLSVPTGAAATGDTEPVQSSGAELPAGTLAAIGMQAHVLVVDDYQRAPFYMPAKTFFRESAPRIVERQWASLRIDRLNVAASADLPAYRFGFSQGAGGEARLGAQLALAWLPRLASPEVDSVALGYATQAGGLRLGLLGTLPASSETTSELTLDSSPLGSRRALGAIAQRAMSSGSYGFSFALADGFERPAGIRSSGAFAVDDGAAVSTGAFVEQALDARTTLKASFELAHHRPQASGALVASDYWLRSVRFAARTALARRTVVSASLSHEWSDEVATLRVPATIDEHGNIGTVAYALPYEDLVGRSSVTLRLDQALRKDMTFRASVIRERSGFGVSLTGIAGMLEIKL